MSDKDKMSLTDALQIAIIVLRHAKSDDAEGTVILKAAADTLENTWREGRQKVAEMMRQAAREAASRLTGEQRAELITQYEAQMRAAGLDPEDYRRRVKAAGKDDDVDAAMALFEEIREKLRAHEAKEDRRDTSA